MARASFLSLGLALAFVPLSLACPGRKEGPPLAVGTSTVSTTNGTDGTGTSLPPKPTTAPLEFILDPLDKDNDPIPESEALRGKRAIVLVVTTYDVGSLAGMRTLEPLFNALPKDAACLVVALQPIGDRPLIAAFMDSVPTPCRRAIGDAKRGRLGDLARVTVIPTVLVLRKDGTLVGGVKGTFKENDVRALLDAAN